MGSSVYQIFCFAIFFDLQERIGINFLRIFSLALQWFYSCRIDLNFWSFLYIHVLILFSRSQPMMLRKRHIWYL